MRNISDSTVNIVELNVRHERMYPQIYPNAGLVHYAMVSP